MKKTRRERSKALIVLLLVLIPVIGCSNPQGYLKVTHEDDIVAFSSEETFLEPIPITTGTVFKIELHSNPTTGYFWYFEGLLDLRYVKMVSEEYIEPTSDLVGAGGKQVFVFETQKTLGLTTLNFAYYRIWEGIQPDTQLFTLHFLIQQ